jgi:hypothetical protein
MKGVSEMKYNQFHLRIPDQLYNQINDLAEQKDKSVNSTITYLIKKGLDLELTSENTDLIAKIVRQQLEVVIKPHVDRLAALSSKSGHMSATAAFLSAQAFQDLVPKEQRRNVKEMFDNARKKGAEFMRVKVDDWGGL